MTNWPNNRLMQNLERVNDIQVSEGMRRAGSDIVEQVRTHQFEASSYYAAELVYRAMELARLCERRPDDDSVLTPPKNTV